MEQEEVKELRFGDVEIRLKPTPQDLSLARRLLDLFEEQFIEAKPKAKRMVRKEAEAIDAKIIQVLKAGGKRKKELSEELNIDGRTIVARLNALMRKGLVARKARGLYSLVEKKG